VFGHDHLFRIVQGAQTEICDILRFSMPLCLLGLASEKLLVKRRLRPLIEERNSLIKATG
jgi:hypothetical protein